MKHCCWKIPGLQLPGIAKNRVRLEEKKQTWLQPLDLFLANNEHKSFASSLVPRIKASIAMVVLLGQL